MLFSQLYYSSIFYADVNIVVRIYLSPAGYMRVTRSVTRSSLCRWGHGEQVTRTLLIAYYHYHLYDNYCGDSTLRCKLVFSDQYLSSCHVWLTSSVYCTRAIFFRMTFLLLIKQTYFIILFDCYRIGSTGNLPHTLCSRLDRLYQSRLPCWLDLYVSVLLDDTCLYFVWCRSSYSSYCK